MWLTVLWRWISRNRQCAKSRVFGQEAVRCANRFWHPTELLSLLNLRRCLATLNLEALVHFYGVTICYMVMATRPPLNVPMACFSIRPRAFGLCKRHDSRWLPASNTLTALTYFRKAYKLSKK